MRRVKVCLLVDTVAAFAGTENQVSETVMHMDSDAFEVHLCCLEDSARLRELKSCCHAAVFPLTRLHSINGLRQILRFRSYLKRNRIEVIHAFMTKTAIFGVLAARWSPCRAVLTSRLSTGYWYTPSALLAFRYLNRHTTRVFANSEAAKRSAVDAERLDPDRIDVIYNGVDMLRYAATAGDASFCHGIGIRPDAPVVGSVANLRPVKDVALFLRAAKAIAAEVPDALFMVVGTGPQREELGLLAADLGIADKVFFSDGRGTVPDYLRRFSVACLTSKSEGFSNAILEYMAAGLPVVATDVGGNAEAIEHGCTGYLVRDRSPEAIAAPVIQLLRDHSGRAVMGQRALDRCRRLFSIETYIRRMQDYYRDLAASDER